MSDPLLKVRKLLGIDDGRFYYRGILSGPYYTVKDNIAYNQREEPIHSLYIGRIPPHMAESDLRDVFATYGAIESFYTITQPYYSGKDNRYGFVRYDNAESAYVALRNRVTFELKGRPMVLMPADRQP